MTDKTHPLTYAKRKAKRDALLRPAVEFLFVAFAAVACYVFTWVLFAATYTH
jgi:hypothetical protein